MRSKKSKIAAFDPNAVRKLNGSIYGLPFTPEESDVVILGVPWSVTISYGGNTEKAPEAILRASSQVDLYDLEIPDAWKIGIALLPGESRFRKKGEYLRKKAEICIRHLEKGGSPNDVKVKKLYAEINSGCEELRDWLFHESQKLLRKGKLVGVLGGDHSVPLGYMQALSKVHPKYSILHLDAHADLRKAYEGFEFSHASIMYHASLISNIDHIVSVGVRDFCTEEADRIRNSHGKILPFFDRVLKKNIFRGSTWKKECEKIVRSLSSKVYISFDIDALSPHLCPHTGTPVPGGLEYEEALFLLEAVVRSGRTIIGFDLSEVSPGKDKESEWDASVGARILYRLSMLMAKSQGNYKKNFIDKIFSR